MELGPAREGNACGRGCCTLGAVGWAGVVAVATEGLGATEEAGRDGGAVMAVLAVVVVVVAAVVASCMLATG